jgi:hypothetical protein
VGSKIVDSVPPVLVGYKMRSSESILLLPQNSRKVSGG